MCLQGYSPLRLNGSEEIL
ncbi:TPA: hypothetical protein ANIA_11566 [Aspergillus nidulans FGSC A4]|uniref:Uncharacterized protein n=1 Tax=Emericella nidulans (strain FGSC A4 / ATCC 38163 / CBS 112.46 / NRRL 194 / M139) TaxID=227321 RepID=C8VBH8_EMENI|nr:TPA: hypothetical protein ANIA_11566 [Aspergillus nidulans FGSC A4]